MLLASLTAHTATGAGFDGVITPKTVETKMLAMNKTVPTVDGPCSKGSALVDGMCSITGRTDFCPYFLHVDGSWMILLSGIWLARAVVG